jgi:cell division inhibitor SepF
MGAWRKAGVWLGLVEDDDDRRYVEDEIDPYDDEFDEPDPPARVRVDRASSRSVTRAPAVPPAPITHDNLALAPQIALRERAVLSEEDGSYRITTLHPTTYNEARTIGEHFREGIPVIMNLTEMDESDAKRLVDFAAGLAFGLRGSIERVTNRVFLLSPANVTVTAEDKARIAEGGFFNQS